MQAAEIRFYRANERPYGVFSNLFRRPIVFEGEVLPTAEHAYQAGKARDQGTSMAPRRTHSVSSGNGGARPLHVGHCAQLVAHEI